MCQEINTEEEKEILWNAALLTNEFLAKLLYRSLREKLSYEDLDKEEYIPYSKDDFYGYQRMCVMYFKNLMIFAGKYTA